MDMLLAFGRNGARDTDLVPKEYSWDQLAQRLARPSAGDKDGSYLIRGGDLREPKRGDENLLKAELLVIDGDSRFDPETGEILTGAPPIDVAKAALDRLGYRYIIHTSYSYVPGEIWKYRIYIPAVIPDTMTLTAAVSMVIEQLHAQGCTINDVKENHVWSQPWYLPRCKPQYVESFRCYASLTGRDVDVAAAVAIQKARTTAEEVIRNAQQELPQRERTFTGESPIETFNRQAGFSTVRVLLENAGYKFAGKKGDILRFIAPSSETGTPGVTVFKGSKRGDIVAYSHHGAHDPLSHRLTDAFGMLTRLRHSGNEEAALVEAKQVTGWKAGEREENLDGFEVEEVDPEVFKEPPRQAKAGPIKTMSLVDLMDDETPEEPDYISPDFLGSGNFCLIAGPPKAQKSFLLTEMLIACATGTSFLGGRFCVSRPLRVFYLQAEMNKKLLRRRAKMMAFLAPEHKQLLHANLVVTERLTMQLTEEGAKAAIEVMKRSFPAGGPDIIAIDPLANLFDGDNEDKAVEIMRFLTGRLEVIRRAVNPLAAIILVHHSAKKSTEDMARDPFVAIRGSGALRGYYDTGIVIYRKSEEGAERQVHFELRNGESPDALTVKLNAFGSFSVLDTTMAGISRQMALAMLQEIDDRWSKNKPLSIRPQSSGSGRYAPLLFARKHEIPAAAVQKLITSWLENEIVEEQMSNSDTKMRGLRKLQNID